MNPTHHTPRRIDMTTKIRRILLILSASSGIIAASTLPAHAGLSFTNHCQPRDAQ